MNDIIENISADQLKSIIERIERLNEEAERIDADKKEVYSEAKNNGFDVKTIRKIVAMRKKKPEELSKEEAVLQLYLDVLGV
jgi:uncharacterized protein (UPF0335 family)